MAHIPKRLQTGAAAVLLSMAIQTHAQISLYENERFDGKSFSTDTPVADFTRFGFNDRASSVIVIGKRWEVCADRQFGGRCMILRIGRYPSLGTMGMNDRITSVRDIEAQTWIDIDRYAPQPPAYYDTHRRDEERLFEAPVETVHAVIQGTQQRCWVERLEVHEGSKNAEAGAAIAGALIGGILGHQIGGGFGKDLATAGGAVAGAVVGSNIAKANAAQEIHTENVQRCRTVPNKAQPEYWDVTYFFRGREHTIQMTKPPGETVTVNKQGEPRE